MLSTTFLTHTVHVLTHNRMSEIFYPGSYSVIRRRFPCRTILFVSLSLVGLFLNLCLLLRHFLQLLSVVHIEVLFCHAAFLGSINPPLTLGSCSNIFNIPTSVVFFYASFGRYLACGVLLRKLRPFATRHDVVSHIRSTSVLLCPCYSANGDAVGWCVFAFPSFIEPRHCS